MLSTVISSFPLTIFRYENVYIKFLNVINRSLIATIFLFVGYYASKFKNKVCLNRYGIIIGLLLLLITLFLSQFNTANLGNSVLDNPLLYYINAILGSCGIIIISKFIFKNTVFLKFYGKNSMVVYVTHMLVLAIISRFLSSDAFIFVLVVCGCCLCILIINKYFKFLINYDAFKNLVFKIVIDFKNYFKD